MYGIGQIGLGQISTTHRDGYRRFGLPIVAGFDISPDARARFLSEEPGAKVYETLDDLLADPAVQVVDLATPHRREMRLPALEGICRVRKPVLIQKPLAESYAEALEMVEMLAAAGLTRQSMVNQNMCFTSPVAEVAQELTRTGTPFLARTTWNWPMDTAEEHWFGKRERWWTTDMTVHTLSVLHFLLGPPETVYAVLGRDVKQPGVRHEGFGHLLLRYPAALYPDGLCATLYSSGTHYGTPEASPQIVLQGPDGVIEVRNGGGYTLSLRDGKTATDAAHKHQQFPRPDKWFPNAFGRAMAHFQAALQAETLPLCSVEDNLFVIAVVEAAYRAHAENRVVALSEIMGERWRGDYGPGINHGSPRPTETAPPPFPDAQTNGYIG